MVALWRHIRGLVFYRLAFLEDEIARLRKENRELLDAMLITKGLPKLSPSETKSLPRLASRPLPSQWRRRIEALAVPGTDREEKANGE